MRKSKVAAMETPESDAAVTDLGRAEERDGFYDLEHLPPLLEDEVRLNKGQLHLITFC